VSSEIVTATVDPRPHNPRACCIMCATWVCKGCLSWHRERADRHAAQRCPNCGGVEGEFVAVRHRYPADEHEPFLLLPRPVEEIMSDHRFKQRLDDAAFGAPLTLEVVEEAIRRIRMHAVDADRVVMYFGKPTAIKDIPGPISRAGMGYGHFLTRRRSETVHPHPFHKDGHDWPWTPETCRVAGWPKGWLWINGGQNLVCPGCGLDGT